MQNKDAVAVTLEKYKYPPEMNIELSAKEPAAILNQALMEPSRWQDMSYL